MVYISRHPNQKAKKVSAYDEEFIVAKLKLISASVNSLKLKSCESAPHLHNLIQVQDPAPQITPKFEPTTKAINLVGTRGTRVHNHDYYLSPAPRNQFISTSCNLDIKKYAYTASQIPFNTPLAKRNLF